MTLDDAASAFAPESRWDTTIGDVCDRFGGEVQTGPFGSQLHASDYSDGGIPVVMPQDMIDGLVSCKRVARVAPAHVNRLQRHVLREGDIVFSRRGDVSRFAVITRDESGWLCGTGSIRIRLNCSEVSTDYLRRYLQLPSVGAWLESHAKGITMANLNTQIIRALPFRRPPLPEQRRIAAILDKADALRAKRREAISKLDQLLQSVFLDMFPATSNPSRPLSTLLANQPAAIRTGPFGSQLLLSEFTESGVPVLGIDNVVSNRFIWARPRFISPEKYEALSRYTVRPGDVLVTIMGTCGRCAVVPADIPTAINTKHICCISLDTAQCDPDYLHSYFLFHPTARRYLAERSKGAIMDGLNMLTIKELPVETPPITKQRQYAFIKEHIQTTREAHELAAERKQSLFGSLQEALLNCAS